MRVTNKVHQIKIMFYITPQIERFVYIYLIVGKDCYLVDAGVDGAEKSITEYMNNIGRDIKDIRAVLLTHSHPDHIGAAGEIKRLTGCKIYASAGEREWIEDIEKQFRERPVPNFRGLLKQSVRIDEIVEDGSVINLEDGITVGVIETGGHSRESLSYYLIEDHILFTGDAIPVTGDIPIYASAAQSADTLHKMRRLEDIYYYCPAWDSIYMGREGKTVIDKAIKQMNMLDQCIRDIMAKHPAYNEDELFGAVCGKLNLFHFTHNPLFKASILSSINEIKASKNTASES
jgi:glyoxylase-like metal-dependent hydrolase (beta-lactamase superfamily II)